MVHSAHTPQNAMDQPRASLRNVPSPTTTRAALGRVLAAGLLMIGLGSCRFEALNTAKQELIRQGHAATVDCLQGERAITGGDELRCEEWDYVRQNYFKPQE
jgi:hypothetical protein